MHTSTPLASEQLLWGTELSAQEPASQTQGPGSFLSKLKQTKEKTLKRCKTSPNNV